MFAFGLAGVAIIGLPPSGGFLGKWLLLQAATVSQQWWWIAVIAAGGLLAAGYVFRVLGSAFSQPERSFKAPLPLPLPRGLALAPLTLAGLALLLGAAGMPVLSLLGVGMPAPAFEVALP